MEKSDYSMKDIIQALRNVGIDDGDNIFIHSNIGFFGRLDGGNDRENYYRIFKDAIFEVIGDAGTLVVPTFSYSFCWNKVFDKEKTPGICGIFSEMVRMDPQSLRSDDANFSIATIGKNAEYFTKDTSAHSFGEKSFWKRFLKCDGKFCNFNYDSASTFIHYVEKLIDVEYRYDKIFPGKFVSSSKEIDGTFYHFVYDLDKSENSPDFTKFDKCAKKLGKAKIADLGRGQIVSISAKDTIELIKKEINKDPGFLIKGSNV